MRAPSVGFDPLAAANGLIAPPRASRCGALSIHPKWHAVRRRTGIVCAATIKVRERIASLTIVPERKCRCLTNMFPSFIHSFVWPQQSHSSVPARTACTPSRGAAVKDGRFFRLVLEGREHGGRIIGAGVARLFLAPKDHFVRPLGAPDF